MYRQNSIKFAHATCTQRNVQQSLSTWWWW